MSSKKWDDMRYNIGNVFARTAYSGRSADVEVETVSGTPTIIRKKSNDNRPLYLMLLLVLALGLGFVIMKNSRTGQVQQPVAQQVRPPQLYPTDPNYQQPQTQQNNPDYYYYDRLVRLREDVANLQESNEVLKTRVQLLGATHNNNWHVYNHNLDKKDLVFFERDWRLNQRPPHIKSTEATDNLFSAWSTD